MFYDLDEPIDFLKDIIEVLDDDGLFVLQMSYTPLMIKQLAFDNICHEHVYYWSLTSLQKLMSFNNSMGDVVMGVAVIRMSRTESAPLIS